MTCAILAHGEINLSKVESTTLAATPTASTESSVDKRANEESDKFLAITRNESYLTYQANSQLAAEERTHDLKEKIAKKKAKALKTARQQEKEKADKAAKEAAEKRIAEQQAAEEAAEKARQEIVNDKVTTVTNASDNVLVTANVIDPDYHGSAISITGQNRAMLEALVQNEAGNQGYIGAALVAQSIHDNMIRLDCYDVATLKASLYDGALSGTPNDDVKNAVSYIFDQGGMAVQHNVFYYYNPQICTSTWHESLTLIIEYEDHRFFCS